MNLISCDSCGVVLDTKKVKFPTDIYNDEGCVDLSKGAWTGDTYVPFAPCPVCREPVLDSQ